MERKLLSLPSFFVLLLIAGIAFLAAPVEDVQAQLTTGNTITVDRKGTETDPVARGASAVFTINFATVAVKVAGEGSPAISEEDGFGVEDIIVTIEATAPAASTTSRSPTAAEFKKAASDTTAGQGQNFEVTIAAPSDSTGNITVALRGYAAGTVEFEEANAGAATYDAAPAPATATETIAYNTRDQAAPTASFEAALGLSGSGTAFTAVGGEGDADRFQIEITVTDAVGLATSGDGVFSPTADVKLTTTLANPPATPPAADAPDLSTFVSWPKGTATATEATHVLVIDPADGATEVKVEVKAESVTDAATPANEIAKTEATVTISPRPKVTITSSADAAPQATGPITVTFGISVDPGATGDPTLEDDEITVSDTAATKGSLERLIAMPPEGGSVAFYEMVITPSYTEATVTVTVAENAVKASGAGASDPGNAEETHDITVTVPTTPTGPTTPMEEVTGVGDKLSGNRTGFSFDLGSTGVLANSFVVLAKSPSGAGFTSGAGNFALTDPPNPMPMDRTRIDIDDETWVDLKLFLVTREGGTIDLIKQGEPVKSLVISEVMWGNDAGLSDPTDSQWIELYNTTNAAITGVWELEFTAKDRGRAMLTSEEAKVTTAASLGGESTSAKPVVDKLSTWRDVGTYWDWRISDSAGGSHGQSGKSTTNSATSVGNQVELVSMQRKINYDNVTKKHKDDAVENRTEQLKAVPGGVAAGNWEATPEHGAMLAFRKGTPGAAPTIKKVDQSGIARGSVVFNEIANRSQAKHDWIELYNKSGSVKKINGWELSLVTATGTDTELFTFTSDDDINVPAGGYLLVVNTDPRNTTLEGGYDVVNPGNSARQSDGVGNTPSRLYYVSDKLDIPNTPFLLILRNGNDKTGTHEKVEDVAGHNPRFDDNAKSTQVWPLNSWSVGALDDLGQKDDKTWVRDQGKAVFHGDAWKPDGGVTGVGIDRNAGTGNFTSGTPGYANNAVQTEVKSDGLKHANPVIISEIMFATDGRSPQWIELHNPSHDQAVNLKGWKLEIFNYYGDETLEVNHYAELKSLPEVRIQPNQTILIVSRATSRTSDSDAFPSNRIIDVWANTELRNALDMQNQRDAILSSTGFYLKLSDPRKTVVDEVGNIDTNRRTNDEPDWELPGGDLENGRSSMVRDIEGSAGDGTEADAWRDATLVDSSKIQPDATELYYGDDDDVGTPGYTPGGVLPVQLSSFYSKRNDAGAVVITWSTESELDNAGFNILRSQSRTGEFVRINAQLIPGAGTTGEKTAYTWTDTGASPNVLYFYQIEDVSLAGDHRTLRTTRLRGYIGAAGKATTTWGDLKSRE